MPIIKNGMVYIDKSFVRADILIESGTIIDIKENIDEINEEVIDATNCSVLPGFVDIHVHLREPGFAYKETIKQGSLACAKGGYTTVCTMANLNPAPDTLENLNVQRAIIKKDACINIYPYATITLGLKGEKLSEMEQMRDYVVGYSDDGKGVQKENSIIKAMQEAQRLNKPLILHCEDESLIKGGYIHDGKYAQKHNHSGISSASEYKMIERDIELAKKYGAHIHICHISCRKSVELIAKAKSEGVRISCEVSPHHLLLNEEELVEDGNFKMNPPLRSLDDQVALLEGLLNNTIDCIATDHAPHSLDEKNRGLKNSAFGIIGIEHAFALLYTNLVKENKLTLSMLIDKLTCGLEVLGYQKASCINIGEIADLCIVDLNKPYIISDDNIISTSKNTPFKHKKVYASTIATIVKGKVVYKNMED